MVRSGLVGGVSYRFVLVFVFLPSRFSTFLFFLIAFGHLHLNLQCWIFSFGFSFSVSPYFFFQIGFILGQTYKFKHYTVRDGLSQSVVTCILQDEKGFMWFGTQDGLNRYDGYNFKVFRNNPKDSTTLRDNFIFSIYQSNNGPLYFETQQGNFHRYNPISESFEIVNKDCVIGNNWKFRVSSFNAQISIRLHQRQT